MLSEFFLSTWSPCDGQPLCPHFHLLPTMASVDCQGIHRSAQVPSKLLKHAVSRVNERNQLVLTCVRRKKERPNSRESTSLSKPSWYFIVKAARLGPFVFLVTATYGALLKVENRNTRPRTRPSTNYSNTDLTGTELGSNPGLGGETPANNGLVPGKFAQRDKWDCMHIWILRTKNINRRILYRERIGSSLIVRIIWNTT